MKDLTTDSLLQTNVAVKLRFPSSLSKNYWSIEEANSKVIYAIPFCAALIVVACANKIKKTDLIFLIRKTNPSLTENQIERNLNGCIDKNIIIINNEYPESFYKPKHFEKWKKSGWDSAAYYHFFTWDAAFLDYSKENGGYAIDRQNMLEYQSQKPDVNRYKQYTHIIQQTPLEQLNTNLTQEQVKGLDLKEKIFFMLAYAFGKIGEKPCYWSEIPLIRRTSPSGGCRHPTEGYFISNDDGIITKGAYHVQTYPIALKLLPSEEGSFVNEMILNAEPSKKILGWIVLTSVFERNMYRYRESRTFRTIHMDVGHILGTLEKIGSYLSINTKVELKFDENIILKLIGASILKEGIMCVMTLYI